MYAKPAHTAITRLCIPVKTGLLLLLILCSARASAQFTVSDSQTAAVLAQKLVGPGVTISNPVLTCSSSANATFTITTQDLGIDSGIVLTSGLAQTTSSSLIGVNGPAIKFASNNNGTPGDASLTALAGQPTLDACVLQFDFKPSGDTVKFNYVFGSEEYPEFACSTFNDVFGFFISGPGYTMPKNIALVPGTTVPVSVNSVNGGTPGIGQNIANCHNTGPGAPFTQYYVDNTGGQTATYDGYTIVLQAVASVQPCSVYHLKLGVADATDGLFDSGVFIEAGSLTSNILKINTKGISDTTSADPYVVRGCKQGKIGLTLSNTYQVPVTIHYQVQGTAINGYDYTQIPDSIVIQPGQLTDTIYITPTAVTPIGPVTVKLLIYTPSVCGAISDVIADSAVLNIFDSFAVHIITPMADTSICRSHTIQLAAEGDVNGRYLWQPSAGLNIDTVLSPIATVTASTTYTLTITLPGCKPSVATTTVNVIDPPAFTLNIHDTSICPGDSIMLSATVAGNSQDYKYEWSPPWYINNDTLASVLVAPDSSITYHVTVSPGSYDCKAADTVHINVRPSSIARFDVKPDACTGEKLNVQLTYQGEGITGLTWQLNGADILTQNDGSDIPYIISYATPGVYTVTVTPQSNLFCPPTPATDTIEVHLAPQPHIALAGDYVCAGGTAIFAANVNDPGYLYRWYPEQYFNNINSPQITGTIENEGFITLRITTEYGCVGSDSIYVHLQPCCIVTFPGAFTPNGDNNNDLFRPISAGHHHVELFIITDRWGQTVYQSDDEKAGWDGKFNGEPMQTGTYFYYVKYKCGGIDIEKKGDVTLIR